MLHTHSLYESETIDLADLSQREEVKSTILACLHEDNMLMVLYTTFPGYDTPLHTHKHEQISMVVSGKAVLRIGDSKRIVRPGDFYVIPARRPHSERSFGDEPFLVMAFYPAGENNVWISEESNCD
jgi:quercetin dioxygenase-like cupin family protein